MKPILFGLALVVGGIVTTPVAAQQAQPPQPPGPAHKVFVLTGCLTGSPAETAAFKLTGAVPMGEAPPVPAVPTQDAKDVYQLIPTSGLTQQGVDRKAMQTHVGKKVEVTVRPEEVLPGPSKPSTSTADAVKPVEATPQRFTVTNIKSLADSCA